jgi:hypothetical protein
MLGRRVLFASSAKPTVRLKELCQKVKKRLIEKKINTT